MGRQHQGMDRPGVRQVSVGRGEQGKMEKNGCEIICGAPTTFAVKGLMMMMMMIPTTLNQLKTVLFKATPKTEYFKLAHTVLLVTTAVTTQYKTIYYPYKHLPLLVYLTSLTCPLLSLSCSFISCSEYARMYTLTFHFLLRMRTHAHMHTHTHKYTMCINILLLQVFVSVYLDFQLHSVIFQLTLAAEVHRRNLH